MAQTETIERLQVEITAQTENFTKQMESVNAKLDALTDASSAGFAGMKKFQSAMTVASVAGNMITSVINKSVGAFTNLAGQLVKSGSEYARVKIATETVTKNLGMTTDEVNGLRDSLAESNTYGIKAEEVIKTLAMSGLVDMANGMKIVKAGTDETIEGVGALVYEMKDLAVVAGVDSAEGIDRVTKFIRRGEATYADGIIEIGNLAGEYSAYAESLGKTASQLTAQERAQVRLNIVNREAEKVYGAYANTMQTSAKAMSSTKAVIRTMGEMLGSYFEPALAVVANGFYQIASGFRNALTDSANRIKEWGYKISAIFVIVVQKIGTLLSKIPLIGKYFVGMANFSVKPLASISNSADKASNSIDGVTDSVNGATKAMQKLAGFDEMNVLEKDDSGSGYAGGAGGIGSDILNMDTAQLEDSSQRIMDIVQDMTNKWDECKAKIAQFFEPVTKLWNNWVVPAWQGFIAVFDLFLSKLNNPAITSFTDILKWLAQFVAGAVVLAIGALVNMLTGVITVVIDAIDKFRNLGNVARLVITEIITWGKNLWSNIQNLVNNIKNSIVNTVNTVKNTVVSVATNIWNSIKNTFANIGGWFSDKFNNAVNGIKNAFNSIPAFFSGIWDKIKTTFSSIGTKAGELVGGAFKNVINGVLTVMDTVINTPIRAINNLIGKVNEIAGVNIGRIGTVDFPRLAKGGIIDNPTVALLGESGREAVVPLENTAWVDELASKINSNGGEQHIVVKIGEDTILDKIIGGINDKALRTGTKILEI